jgi:hypothetical protein
MFEPIAVGLSKVKLAKMFMFLMYSMFVCINHVMVNECNGSHDPDFV